ncbi:hypothetical protein LJ754_07290 [Arthrobacter sp. zg-Y40]|uniref:STM3941 family protein n=1 Tax=Arthrobacter sp. zg-Y40 TaxID=2886939 RepID=UPI001D133B95|nr:STM3941 family protein [Arthrobacter sp. zg-Y40]MCC3278960.1 hypothetical protein [Arthrobacter sp. zg-Y40]
MKNIVNSGREDHGLEAEADRGLGPGLRPTLSPGLEPLTFSVSKIRVLGLGLMALLFAAGCAALVVHGFTGHHHHGSGRVGGSLAEVVAGLIGVAFFGGGAFFFVWKKLREPELLTLTEQGIMVASGGFIPWDNFAAVGIGRTMGGPGGAKIIGIRVKSQERLVATMSPGDIRAVQGVAKAGRLFGRIMPGRGLRGQREALGALRSMPQHGPVATFQWTRDVSGWDVSWSPLVFNRRSATVVRIIEDYHRAVLKLRP